MICYFTLLSIYIYICAHYLPEATKKTSDAEIQLQFCDFDDCQGMPKGKYEECMSCGYCGKVACDDCVGECNVDFSYEPQLLLGNDYEPGYEQKVGLYNNCDVCLPCQALLQGGADPEHYPTATKK